jgi:pimeloyl-ACP methyl ester carboxylesterase
MTLTSWTGIELQLQLSSVRLQAKRWGSEVAPLAICIPGLSQDERSFDFLAGRLAGEQRQVLALALRGRGRSDATAPGTYGWETHAGDVLEAAGTFGIEKFDLIGWSMGAFVAMLLAARNPERVRRLVLIDAAGRPDPSSLGPIAAGVERLGVVYPTPAAYVERVQSTGAIADCADQWQSYAEGDLVETDAGFAARTSRDAVLEDATYGSTQDPYAFWPLLSMPVLLVRAAKAVLPGLGFIVPEADRERFQAELKDARVVDIDANHYCVGMVAATADAVRDFIAR